MGEKDVLNNVDWKGGKKGLFFRQGNEHEPRPTFFSVLKP